MRIRAFPVSNFAAEAKKPSLPPPSPLPLPRVPPAAGGKSEREPTSRVLCVRRPSCPLPSSLPVLPRVHSPRAVSLYIKRVCGRLIYLFIHLFILRPYVRDSGGIRRV